MQFLNLSYKNGSMNSNKPSTLSMTDTSRVVLPVVNGQFQSKDFHIPKSLFLGQTSFSMESNQFTESSIEDNLARSRKSKESIERKRQIIRKMNEKILNLQKKTKTEKMDIYQLEACKNDLLVDFLQYEKSKRRHHEQNHETLKQNSQIEKSFFFMKTQNDEPTQEQQARNTFSFIKKDSKKLIQEMGMQQKSSKIRIKPIQIFIPIVKMIDIEIPMLNLGANKIRQTNSTDAKFTKQSEEYFTGIANQIQQFGQNGEVTQNQLNDKRDMHLHLNSSRSELYLNQGRVVGLNSERSNHSTRRGRGSDRFFVQEEDLINNLKQKDYVEKRPREGQRDKLDISQPQINRQAQRSYENILDRSLNSSILQEQELKLHSQLSKKESSHYQAKRMSIQNHANQHYEMKIAQLEIDLREKALEISELIKKNEELMSTIERLSRVNEQQEHAAQEAGLRVQMLEEKVFELQKEAKWNQANHTDNSNKLMQEIYALSNELQSKNDELSLALDSLEVLEHNSYNKEKQLLKEIQSLQVTLQKQREEIQFFKKRVQQEGIKLNYTQIELIEEALEDREKMYVQNVQKLKDIYESEINSLKVKYSNLEEEAKSLVIKNDQLLEQSSLKQPRAVASQIEVQVVHEEDFKHLIDIYDKELQTRDNQVIELKRQLNITKMALNQVIQEKMQSERSCQAHKQSKQIQTQCNLPLERISLFNHEQRQSRNPNDLIMITILIDKNQKLEQQLSQQMSQKREMNKKLMVLSQLIQKDLHSPNPSIQDQASSLKQEEQKESDLISKLTQSLQATLSQLQKQKQMNKKLKKQLNEQKPFSPSSQSRTIATLKQKVKKLTKYSQLLQKQIKEIYKVSECQQHHKIIQRLQDQLQNKEKNPFNVEEVESFEIKKP